MHIESKHKSSVECSLFFLWIDLTVILARLIQSSKVVPKKVQPFSSFIFGGYVLVLKMTTNRTKC